VSPLVASEPKGGWLGGRSTIGVAGAEGFCKSNAQHMFGAERFATAPQLQQNGSAVVLQRTNPLPKPLGDLSLRAFCDLDLLLITVQDLIFFFSFFFLYFFFLFLSCVSLSSFFFFLFCQKAEEFCWIEGTRSVAGSRYARLYVPWSVLRFDCGRAISGLIAMQLSPRRRYSAACRRFGPD